MTDAASLGTILGVWAHPDDDIFLTAGLMATAVRAGNRVVDVTATRGEGGSMDEERWPPATMGAVRTKELLRSLEILGVTEHRFLEGPVDVDMDEHLDEAGAAQVLAIVAEVQPDTILTFGPDGMTGHQAHMDVCRWATEAFEAAAKPGARLYYATQTPEFVAEVVPADRAVQHLPSGDTAGHPARRAGHRLRRRGGRARPEARLARGAREPDRGPPRGLRRGRPQPVPPRRVVPRRRPQGGVDGRALEADGSRDHGARELRDVRHRRIALGGAAPPRGVRLHVRQPARTRPAGLRRRARPRGAADGQGSLRLHAGPAGGDDRDRGRSDGPVRAAVRRGRHPHDERQLRRVGRRAADGRGRRRRGDLRLAAVVLLRDIDRRRGRDAGAGVRGSRAFLRSGPRGDRGGDHAAHARHHRELAAQPVGADLRAGAAHRARHPAR